MSNIFIPETLDYCRHHYVHPVADYINCKSFGNTDGMDGACWWCKEMTPYQWFMCCDETWVRNLCKDTAQKPCATRDEAMQRVEKFKQTYPIKDK